MGFIGSKKGLCAPWFVPDGQRRRWLSRGNRIIRRATPEDGESDIAISLSRLKAKKAAEAALPPPPTVLVPIVTEPAQETLLVSVDDEQPRASKRRKKVD